MSYLWNRLLISLLCLGALSGVRAEVVPDLYQQGVLVASQGADERRKAAREALAAVLVRVTGQPEVLSRGAASKLLARASQLVDTYRYESTEDFLQRGEQQLPASRLILTFSRSGIEAALRRAGLPLWPDNRPAVLVWLVKDDLRSGRQLVSLQQAGELADAVAQVTQRRGLPVVVPLLDLQDQLAISADDVWRLDGEAIRAASVRYGVDAIAIGRYSQTSSGRWLGAWSLLHKQQLEVFDSHSDVGEAALLDAGLEAISSYLAAAYAIVTNGDISGGVLMQLQQVDDFAGYVAALEYLENMAVVRQLELVALEDRNLWVYLHTEGELSALLDTLALDRRLQPINGPDNGAAVALPRQVGAPLGSTENPLRFLWPG